MELLIARLGVNPDTVLTENESTTWNEIKNLIPDFDYLHEEIKSSMRRIPSVRRDIREHLDLNQIRRTTILAILAGLYIPLNFVTVIRHSLLYSLPKFTNFCQSFFGMNIIQYGHPQSSWHNTTQYPDPTNPNNITTSTSQIVDTGNNQAWSLGLFFEIAIPLMFGTILVPLIVGSVIRWLLQAIARGQTWWRLALAFIVIL